MLVCLEDRVAVVVRPIRPDDKALLSAGLARFSERTAYMRFLGPKQQLSLRELTYLTEIDFRDHFAVVAVLADDPDVLVGVARWVRGASDPETAEVAFVVADEYQRQGLGTVLLRRLEEAARERGVRRFVATTLPQNLAAHRLFARVSEERRTTFRDGLHELQAELAA